MTVHFIYVKGDLISTPFAITNEVSRRLREHYDVVVYDWLDRSTITPQEGDILLGHPHPSPGTIFRNSFAKDGWSKRILLCPFAHALPKYVAWLDQLVCECDRYLAICGRYWSDTVEQSICSHWAPRIEQVDLAVNREHFPFVKHRFSPAGKRRFLNIGSIADCKGTDVLEALAAKNPECEFGWIGGGRLSGSVIRTLGPQDFSTPEARELVAAYDFLIHCGRSDANPTTILEAAAWGLIPVCTPQSGYYGEPWIRNIPLNDLEKATEIIRELNAAPEDELVKLQAEGQSALSEHYYWDRFTEQVLRALRGVPAESRITCSSPLEQSNRRRLARIAARNLAEMRCRHYLHRLRLIASGLRRRLRAAFQL